MIERPQRPNNKKNFKNLNGDHLESFPHHLCSTYGAIYLFHHQRVIAFDIDPRKISGNASVSDRRGFGREFGPLRHPPVRRPEVALLAAVRPRDEQGAGRLVG